MRKIVALLVASALLLSGCASVAPKARGDKLQVAATTTQLQDFLAQIGGDKIQIVKLLKPGASAHSFDPAPQDLQALAQADLLFVNGAGLDDFIDTAVTASGFSGKKIVASSGVNLRQAAKITKKIGKNAGQGGHGKDQGVDPHLWTAPKIVAQMLPVITKELAAADPKNAKYYQQRAAAYEKKLVQLDTWLRQQFAKVPSAQKKFVSTHNALIYFLYDYKIEFVGSVIPSFEDNAEPSATEINKLVANIKKYQVPAVFIESSSSDRLNTTVAKEAGVPVVTDPLYVDSLAASGQAASYIGATVANAQTMLTAWGYPPEELPSQLQQ